MQPQTTLENLGYPKNQVKIYLALLEIGEAKVADIAVKVGIPRSTVVELLEEMHKQDLLNYYTKKNHKYWVAENPDKLLTLLKTREIALVNVLPQLHLLRFDSRAGKPNVKIFTGIEEIKLIMNDMIDTKHHIFALVSEDDFRKDMGEEFMDDFIERRKKHFLSIKFIGPHSERTLELKQRDADDSRHTRFLPNHIELHKVSNFIYGNKVAIISLNQKEPTGIIIEDPNIARAMTIYYDSLWHHSTEL